MAETSKAGMQMSTTRDTPTTAAINRAAVRITSQQPTNQTGAPEVRQKLKGRDSSDLLQLQVYRAS